MAPIGPEDKGLNLKPVPDALWSHFPVAWVPDKTMASPILNHKLCQQLILYKKIGNPGT